MARNTWECDECGRNTKRCICPARHKVDLQISVGPSVWAVLALMVAMLFIE